MDFLRLQHLLETLSLSGMEARTMVGLLRLGSGGMAQLSELSGISRPNLYPVLDSLAAKGLCQRAPGRYPLWVTAGVDEVVAILKEARVNSALRSLAEAEALMAKLPDVKRVESPVTLVSDAQSAIIYLEAMDSVESEILVLNRGPYPGDLEPAQPVLDALARGVKARALWQTAEMNDPGTAVRDVADAYAQAGVDQRVVEELPVSLAVLGEKVILLSLPNEDPASSVSFHAAVIRHQGMTRLLTAAFDRLWDQAQPYDAKTAVDADADADV